MPSAASLPFFLLSSSLNPRPLSPLASYPPQARNFLGTDTAVTIYGYISTLESLSISFLGVSTMRVSGEREITKQETSWFQGK